MTENQESKANNKNVLYVLGILLLLSLVGNIYLFTRNSTSEQKIISGEAKVDSLEGVKKALEGDFQAMTFELDQFKGKNIQLDSLVERANSDIEKQKLKIERLIKENKDIPLIRRQMEELKAIREQYRAQIETLIKENKELRFANVNLTQEVDNLSKTTKDLSAKVEIASELKTENVDVKTLREKGKGKMEETERAKKVSRITTTFVIAENRVAKPGQRQVNLRILKPDGYVLTDPNSGSGNFTKADGRSTEYTVQRTVEYNNQRSEVIFDVNPTDALTSGLYISEVYLDGKLMGTYKFTLK